VTTGGNKSTTLIVTVSDLWISPSFTVNVNVCTPRGRTTAGITPVAVMPVLLDHE
jgi:hypothetical protein